MKPFLAIALKAAAQTQRVAFLTALRKLAELAAPKNKVGTPILSDLDLLCMSDEQHRSAAETAGISTEGK